MATTLEQTFKSGIPHVDLAFERWDVEKTKELRRAAAAIADDVASGGPFERMDEYERFVVKMWTVPIKPYDAGQLDPYPFLGLPEEAGEVAGNAKRVFREEGGVVTDERRQKMLVELGDTLWYVVACAVALRSSLQEVAEINRKKIKDRHARGTMLGEGDDR